MGYIDFTKKTIELYGEMENVIRGLAKKVSEIDLTESEEDFWRACIIRSRDIDGCLEEVEVTELMSEGDNLYNKGVGA